MKKRIKKALVVGTLIIGILGMMSSIPNGKALSLSYNDDVWTYLTVSGPDLTKPGNTESYTVSGKLSVLAYGSVHIKFWLDTSSELSKVILEEDPLPYGTYGAGYTFTKTYQVFIPNDAINNRYIYAKLDTTTRHFSNFGVSLVQDPTYSELQSQVSNLQSQVTNLQSKVNNLESYKSNLQSQVNDLQTDKNNLQSQINTLNSNITSLESEVTSLESENSNFDSQVSSLQSQINNIRAQNATTTSLALLLGVITAVFVVTTIYFATRKPKVKTA